MMLEKKVNLCTEKKAPIENYLNKFSVRTQKLAKKKKNMLTLEIMT